MPRMPDLDNIALVMEYDRMTKEVAKGVTTSKVSFAVERIWVKTIPGCHSGARLITITNYPFGKDDPRILLSYEVCMAKWLFDIIKEDRKIMRKFIAHEIAHIPCGGGHGEDFMACALALGAEDLVTDRFVFTVRINRAINLLLPIIWKLPYYWKYTCLKMLGAQFGIKAP
jgi:hypothetical protein